MNNQIQARKLTVSNINHILMNIQCMSTSELQDTVKIMASDIKNDIKIIHKNYDDIDRVNDRYRTILAERRYLFERCHALASEINSLKNKLARVVMCDHCKKCCL